MPDKRDDVEKVEFRRYDGPKSQDGTSGATNGRRSARIDCVGNESQPTCRHQRGCLGNGRATAGCVGNLQRVVAFESESGRDFRGDPPFFLLGRSTPQLTRRDQLAHNQRARCTHHSYNLEVYQHAEECIECTGGCRGRRLHFVMAEG